METIQIKNIKELVPELRFKGFINCWEKIRMEQLADCYDGTHQTPIYVQSGIPFVSVENIKSYSSNSKFITKEAFDKDFKNKPKKGDIFMTRITAGIIGMTSIVENDDDLAYYVSVALIRKKKNICSSFLAHRIESEGFKRELHKRIIHVAFPKKINLGDLQKCITYTPPSLPEQQKIASFLSAVDEKIQQLSRKKELLEQYKKGVMQQLFSGKLRFKDENGEDYADWEEKKLGDLTKITTGKLDANAMVHDGEYRFYTCAKDYSRIDKFAFDTEALLISGNGANVGYIHYYKGKFNAYQRTYVLDRIKEDIFYLKFYLDNFLYERIYTEKKEGNTPYIVMSTLSEMEILLPSLQEQQKIANFLTSIDAKIESTSQQINQMQSFKKGLLQKMFV